MSSERKIQSARENGRKSRGAVTSEGKRNSARNATRHGLLARTLLLGRESAARFSKVVTELHEGPQPETPAEAAAAEARSRAFRRLMAISQARKNENRKRTHQVVENKQSTPESGPNSNPI